MMGARRGARDLGLVGRRVGHGDDPGGRLPEGHLLDGRGAVLFLLGLLALLLLVLLGRRVGDGSRGIRCLVGLLLLLCLGLRLRLASVRRGRRRRRGARVGGRVGLFALAAGADGHGEAHNQSQHHVSMRKVHQWGPPRLTGHENRPRFYTVTLENATHPPELGRRTQRARLVPTGNAVRVRRSRARADASARANLGHAGDARHVESAPLASDHAGR